MFRQIILHVFGIGVKQIDRMLFIKEMVQPKFLCANPGYHTSSAAGIHDFEEEIFIVSKTVALSA